MFSDCGWKSGRILKTSLPVALAPIGMSVPDLGHVRVWTICGIGWNLGARQGCKAAVALARQRVDIQPRRPL